MEKASHLGNDPKRSYGASVTGKSAEKEKTKIAQRAGIVATGTLLSRVLGLGRDIVVAAVFSRAATDAWLIAWQLPNVLRQLLAEGAVQASVLPVLAKIQATEGEEAAQRYFRAIRGLSLCTLLLVSLLGMLFAPTLVRIYAPGFDSEQQLRTIQLTRWVFPYILFMGTAALGMAALNTHRRFVVTSFAPALLNVSFLLFALTLPGWLGARGEERILAMAIGGLAGGALQVVAQWPSLRAIGYLKAPTIDLKHPEVSETLRRLAPTLLGIGVYSLDLMIGRRLLSELDQGAVTYFSYGMRLCDFSQGIFVMALATATLPTLSRFVSLGQMDEVASTFSFSLRMALFVGIPATFLTVTLAGPLVSAVFERGQFTAFDTAQTSRALMAQGLGIFLVSGVRQMVIVFFAFGRTMTPVYVAIVDLIVFALLGMGLRDNFGHVGVSLAVTGARITQFTLLWFALGRLLPTRHPRQVATTFLKTSIVSLVAALVAYWSTERLGLLLPPSALRVALTALSGISIFGLCYLGGVWALKCEELSHIVDPIRRRLRSNRR